MIKMWLNFDKRYQ